MILSMYLRGVTLIGLLGLGTAIRRYESFPDGPTRETVSRRLLEEIQENHEQRQLKQEENDNHDQRRIALSAEDHLVTSLPYLPPNAFPSKHYAGHIPASKDGDKKLFYWLFEPHPKPPTNSKEDEDVPLLIWLNGGPGCSSMDGLWLENGPFRLRPTDKTGQGEDWVIGINEYSWHTTPAYVLYIDQPVGTGLSFTKKGNYCKNDHEINVDFYYFLQSFLQLHQDSFLKQEKGGKKVMKRPLYFSGESHAGHYIPSMMDYILQRNDDEESPPEVYVNLRGAAIGNGWMDPYHQYATADAAFGAGIVDLSQLESYREMEKQCQHNMDNGDLASSVCFKLLDDVVAQSSGKTGKYSVSAYDNRIWEEKKKARSFPLGHHDVESYLGGWTGAKYSNMNINYKTVLNAIHATESISAGQRYEECTDPPYYALIKNDGLGVVQEIVNILEHSTKPRLLFFNGVNDLICNHVGNERALNELPWEHAQQWLLANRYSWIVDDAPPNESGPNEPSGYMKEFQNLLFLKVVSSGHMVPMDLPYTSLVMMRTFMDESGSKKLDFRTSMQGKKGKIPKEEHCNTDPCPRCDKVEKPMDAEDASNNNKMDGSVDEKTNAVPPTKMFFAGWTVLLFGVLFLLFKYKQRRTRDRIGQRIGTHEIASELELQSNNGVGYRDEPGDAEEASM